MGEYPIELILAALLAISELLAISPLKSNSVFQLIRSILQSVKLVKKLEDKKDE